MLTGIGYKAVRAALLYAEVRLVFLATPLNTAGGRVKLDWRLNLLV